MKGRPLDDETQDSRWQIPRHESQGPNRDGRPPPRIPDMKVRRSMVQVVHSKADSEEAADLGHGSLRSGGALRTNPEVRRLHPIVELPTSGTAESRNTRIDARQGPAGVSRYSACRPSRPSRRRLFVRPGTCRPTLSGRSSSRRPLRPCPCRGVESSGGAG